MKKRKKGSKKGSDQLLKTPVVPIFSKKEQPRKTKLKRKKKSKKLNDTPIKNHDRRST